MNWRCAGSAWLGATQRCLLPAYGRNGEDFFLYDWTRECWNHVSLSKPPALKPLPPTPTIADKDVQAREAALRAEVEQRQGTLSTVKTDLAPGDLTGQRRVLLGV